MFQNIKQIWNKYILIDFWIQISHFSCIQLNLFYCFQNQEIRIQAQQYQRIEKDPTTLLFHNYEQFVFLKWIGDYNEQFNKVGKWDIFWDGNIIGGGSFDYEGNQKKIGKWVELDEGFHDQKSIVYTGEYNKNGMKVGGWVVGWVFDSVRKQIGGGQYDQEGNQKKIGKWVELFEGFSIFIQVVYVGNYDRNGMKVGRWDISHFQNAKQQYKLITQIYIQSGGGSYDQEGNQIKIGKWVEQDEGFQDWKQIVFNGDYNAKGMKIGRWDILYCQSAEQQYKQIGGGSYDQEGNQTKIGKWIELSKRFSYFNNATYKGEYNTNGMKVGRWDIMYCQMREQEYKQIGGGLYDQEGNQKKIGKWVELDETNYDHQCATYHGEYNTNGRKVGKWDIMYSSDGKEQKKIGGGSYDQQGNQKKIGKWVELFEGFNQAAQVTYIGEYDLNNMKVGRWDIMHCDPFGDGKYKKIKIFNKYILSGGGLYDQKGSQKKIGQWVELFHGFQIKLLLIQNGEYNKNGTKVGRWDTMFCQLGKQKYEQIINNPQSGGGSYDQEGNQRKIGKWIELDCRFICSCWQLKQEFGDLMNKHEVFNNRKFQNQINSSKKVIYSGEYNLYSKKVGQWDTLHQESTSDKFWKIGGGSYDQEGNQLKVGKWVELDTNFKDDNPITHKGEYNSKGQKKGIWTKWNRSLNYKVGEQNYDI